MKIIKQTNLISGGNPAAAAVVVVTSAAALGQSVEYFINAGERIGEKIYTSKNPDDGLGKMVYTKDDFKQPNWYYTSNTHPNNQSWDSFNNGFGGF